MEQQPDAGAAANARNAAVAAALRGGLPPPPPAAPAAEPSDAPQSGPTDVERIAAQLGYDLCSDEDDSDDECCPRAPADAQLEAWAREEAQLDGPATTASEILEAPPPPLLAELAVSPTTPLTRVGHVEGFAEEGCVVIPSPTALEGILGKYYRHSKYASFQRQLNNFGFHRQAGAGVTIYRRSPEAGGRIDSVDAILGIRHVVRRKAAAPRPKAQLGDRYSAVSALLALKQSVAVIA